MQVNKGRVMVKNPKNVKQEPYSWGQLDMLVFSRNFITICNQVKDIYKSESRLVEIQAPAYIMGGFYRLAKFELRNTDVHCFRGFARQYYKFIVLWKGVVAFGPRLVPLQSPFLGRLRRQGSVQHRGDRIFVLLQITNSRQVVHAQRKPRDKGHPKNVYISSVGSERPIE